MNKKLLRKIGIALTALSLFFGAIIVVALIIELSQLDDKGWDILLNIVYHIIIVFYMTAAMTGVLIGTVMWGLAIRNFQNISTKESITQKLFLLLSIVWFGSLIYHNITS